MLVYLQLQWDGFESLGRRFVQTHMLFIWPMYYVHTTSSFLIPIFQCCCFIFLLAPSLQSTDCFTTFHCVYHNFLTKNLIMELVINELTETDYRNLPGILLVIPRDQGSLTIISNLLPGKMMPSCYWHKPRDYSPKANWESLRLDGVWWFVRSEAKMASLKNITYIFYVRKYRLSVLFYGILVCDVCMENQRVLIDSIRT